MVALRIAIADDEPDMRDYLARVLPRLGHTVVATAVNGRELVEVCQKEHPQLVITDVRMPELDGIDAVKLIWQDSEIPIVFLSAFHIEDRISAAAAEHVIVNLEKPIKLPALGTAIECVHTKHRLMGKLLHSMLDLTSLSELHILLEAAIDHTQKQLKCDLLSALHYLENQTITLQMLQSFAE